MECRHNADSAEVEPVAVDTSYSGFSEEVLQGDRSQKNDDLWRDQVDLAKKEWNAFGHFVVFRISVVGRTAFDDVCDIDFGTLEAHGVNHLGKERASRADEWNALFVLFASRGFADEHQVRVGISRSEDHIASSLRQSALRAFPQAVMKLFEVH